MQYDRSVKQFDAARLQGLRCAANTGQIEDPITGSRMTLRAACEAWLRYVRHDKNRAGSTVGDYERTCRNHFWHEFGEDTPIRQIKMTDVEKFRERRLAEGEMTRASIHEAMVLLHGCMNCAKRNGWIASNLCEDVERVTVPKSGDFQVLSAEEVHAVIRAADIEQDAAIFAVAAFAGLRMGGYAPCAGAISTSLLTPSA
jgi:site-specific recombinase XerD